MNKKEIIDELSVLYERINSKDNFIYVSDIKLQALEEAIERLQRKSHKSDARRWKRRYFDLKNKMEKENENN